MKISNFLYTISLIFLPIWWIFVVLWQPSFVSLLASVAYRFEPPVVSSETVDEARQRALLYSTRGVTNQADVVFTASELSHLSDVYGLYVPASRIVHFFGTCAWIVLLAAVLRKDTLSSSFRAAWKVYAFLFAVVLLSLAAFSTAFILFHEVLFPQGNWSFPADSLLIQAFPETFWKLMLVFVVACLGLASLSYRQIATASK